MSSSVINKSRSEIGSWGKGAGVAVADKTRAATMSSTCLISMASTAKLNELRCQICNLIGQKLGYAHAVNGGEGWMARRRVVLDDAEEGCPFIQIPGYKWR